MMVGNITTQWNPGPFHKSLLSQTTVGHEYIVISPVWLEVAHRAGCTEISKVISKDLVQKI